MHQQDQQRLRHADELQIPKTQTRRDQLPLYLKDQSNSQPHRYCALVEELQSNHRRHQIEPL